MITSRAYNQYRSLVYWQMAKGSSYSANASPFLEGFYLRGVDTIQQLFKFPLSRLWGMAKGASGVDGMDKDVPFFLSFFLSPFLPSLFPSFLPFL